MMAAIYYNQMEFYFFKTSERDNAEALEVETHKHHSCF